METLRRLRHAIALAQHRHFGRAAAASGISQAALTLSIKNLEDEYGAPLFIRRPGGIDLTPFGERVVASATKVLGDLAHLRRELDMLRTLEAGRLIVGCDPYFSESLAAPALNAILRKHPKLEFDLALGTWSTQLQDLLDRRIDVYVGHPPLATDDRVTYEGLKLPPLQVFCRPKHPLLDLRKITLADVFKYPRAAPPSPPWLSRWLQEELREAYGGEERPHPYLMTFDYAAIKRMVRETDAVAIGFTDAVREYLHMGSIVALDVPALSETPVVVATLLERALPPAASEFQAALRARALEMVTAPDVRSPAGRSVSSRRRRALSGAH